MLPKLKTHLFTSKQWAMKINETKLAKGITPEMREYIKIMRDYRFKAGISQPELAAKMGIRQQKYSNVETGRIRMNIDFAQRFKKATGINPLRGLDINDHAAPILDTPKLTSVVRDYGDTDIEVLRKEIEHRDEIIALLKRQIELLEEKK